MNAGLTTIVANTATAIHPLGQEVLYNGIARSPGRDDFRNIGLLNYADIASNESFCYAVDPDGAVRLRSLPDDWAIMKAQAANLGKKIIQMINYVDRPTNVTTAITARRIHDRLATRQRLPRRASRLLERVVNEQEPRPPARRRRPECPRSS